MADLSTTNPASPLGTASPTQGDNELRTLKAELKGWALAASETDGGTGEHADDGQHRIPDGATGTRTGNPAHGALFINTTPTVPELDYYNGSTWVTIATLNEMDTHQTANPIDHPDGSITTAKYGAGSIDAAAIGGGEIDVSHFATAEAAAFEAVTDIAGDGVVNADAYHEHTSAAITDGVGSDTAFNPAPTTDKGYVNGATFSANIGTDWFKAIFDSFIVGYFEVTTTGTTPHVAIYTDSYTNDATAPTTLSWKMTGVSGDFIGFCYPIVTGDIWGIQVDDGAGGVTVVSNKHRVQEVENT